MSQQSHVITFPVVMKDEKKYSGCVDVLDTFEDWVHTLYSIPESTADTADETSCTENSFLPGSTLISRPDQPGSHIPPTAATDDVLAGVRIPCYGDQLTRVRLAGAKDLRAGCHSPRQRIDHIYPYRIVDWHSKRSFLKVCFLKLQYKFFHHSSTLQEQKGACALGTMIHHKCPVLTPYSISPVNGELYFIISFRWHLKDCTRKNQSEKMVLWHTFVRS